MVSIKKKLLGELEHWPLDREQIELANFAVSEISESSAKIVLDAVVEAKSAVRKWADHKESVGRDNDSESVSEHSVQFADDFFFRPLNDWIVVRVLDDANTVRRGIIIPETVSEKVVRGEVLGVGRGAYDKRGERLAPRLAKGDLICFLSWSGTEVRINGCEFVLVRESEVMGLVDELESETYQAIVA